MSDTPPKVFISYAHEEGDHQDRVLALANSLRLHGLDVILDQHHPHPARGWPHWMTEHLEAADFILMVCTPAYYRRVMNKEKAGIGLGAQWEGRAIFNLINKDSNAGSRFIPIVLDGAGPENIPSPVEEHTHYRLSVFDLVDLHYEGLYRHLTGQPATPPPEIGPVVQLAPRGFGQPAEPLQQPQADLQKTSSVKTAVAGKSASAYVDDGLAYHAMREYDKAIQCYDRSIVIDPKYTGAYCKRGLAYYDMHQYDRAIQDYNQAIAIDPKYAGAYCKRGIAQHANGNFDEAIQDYNQAIVLNPRYVDAYYNRGIVYRTIGQNAPADTDFKMSKHLQKPSSDTKIQLQQVRKSDSGDGTEAESQTNKTGMLNEIVKYSATRLCFKSEKIEPLPLDGLFQIITPNGTFQMTKAEFYITFANVVASKSYTVNGLYHYATLPRKALPYKLPE